MGRPNGSILEVRFKGNVNTQECMTVLHYAVGVASGLNPAGAEENAFINAIDAGGAFDIITSYLACISDDYTLTEIDAQFVASIRFVNVTKAKNLNGAIVSPCDAQNVSAVLTKRTEFAGRDKVGSVHIPGQPISVLAAGFITGAQLVRMALLASKLETTVTVGVGTYVPVIWHRTLQAPLNQDPITEIFAQNTVRVMRRRTVGVGI